MPLGFGVLRAWASSASTSPSVARIRAAPGTTAHWVGKFLILFLPGAGGVGAEAKAASRSGTVVKAVRGALGRLFSGAARKAGRP